MQAELGGKLIGATPSVDTSYELNLLKIEYDDFRRRIYEQFGKYHSSLVSYNSERTKLDLWYLNERQRISQGGRFKPYRQRRQSSRRA